MMYPVQLRLLLKRNGSWRSGWNPIRKNPFLEISIPDRLRISHPISRRLLSRSDLERDVTILLRKRRELFFPQEEKGTGHCVRESRDAMKGKLPALTSNLNFTGRYLVLTTGDKKFGLSSKLTQEDRHRLSGWLKEEADRPDKEFGIIVRTNAADASKEEILKELEWLKGRYYKAVVQGRNRTCFSLVLETEPFYVAAVRDAYGRDLDEIITDVPEIRETIQGYLEEISPELKEKLRFYQDKLLPLYKLYRVETALDTIQKEKVWLNSGGFLVIQQTEAFVSIDVNSGKYTGKKKMEETFRKINLEAAAEISRQLRLRNLSVIILIDFINMENPDHRDELFHVLQKLLRKDPIKSRAIDITPLHILEMTRKKVRRPVIEDIRELAKK